MKKLLSVALSIIMLAVFTGLGAAQQKAEERRMMPTRPPDAAVMGQKDPCAGHKKDAKTYAACKKAEQLGSGQVGGGPAQQVSVCSGGYWWTGGWGGWTQGGPCSPEGAIK